ncbi:YrzI family small protein [Neobacillus pocheonensis]
MTLNIFFLTITIIKRKMTLDDAIRREMVEKLYEKIKDRQISMREFM